MTEFEPATARVRQGTRGELGIVAWIFSRLAGVATGTAAPRLFLTLGRNRRLFRGWLYFACGLMPRGILPRRLTEFAILRVAHLQGCRYEFDHHIRLSRKIGVSSEDVQAIIDGVDASRYSTKERVLLATVDLLHYQQDLDDTSWAALRQHFSERECIELCMLVGHYEMLATLMTTLRIEPDLPRRVGARNISR